MLLWALKTDVRRRVARSAQQILMGRLMDPNRPEKGRFLRSDVEAIFDQAWRNVDQLLPEARLERIPSVGNRVNTFLAVLTVAAYHAFLAAGIERQYAIELFADVGWKIYAKPIWLPRLVARLLSRDPQRQLNLMLRMMMFYPFNTPGRPGYECKAWAEADHFCTYWTHCPPYAFVKEYVDRHGDHGELEAFRKSWCSYDWAITYAMLEDRNGRHGHYERSHTLSAGDDVCDMRWFASTADERQSPAAPATRPEP